LEFRIVANLEDDRDAIHGAQSDFERAAKNPEAKQELYRLAKAGKPPPPPVTDKGEKAFSTGFTYSWVPLSPAAVRSLQQQEIEKSAIALALQRSEPQMLSMKILLFVRKRLEPETFQDERHGRGDEYFYLMRDPEIDAETGASMAVTAEHLESVTETVDARLQPALAFRLTDKGGELFYELTSKNRPNVRKETGETVYRQLAIIVAGQVVTAPRLNEAIRKDGQITGNFTKAEVQAMLSSIHGQ
jgi:hypothetical protein